MEGIEEVQGVQDFLSRIFRIYGQPNGVTVHSQCVENFADLLQRYVGDGWVGEC